MRMSYQELELCRDMALVVLLQEQVWDKDSALGHRSGRELRLDKDKYPEHMSYQGQALGIDQELVLDIDQARKFYQEQG